MEADLSDHSNPVKAPNASKPSAESYRLVMKLKERHGDVSTSSRWS